LRHLLQHRLRGDLLIYITDEQSWLDSSGRYGTTRSPQSASQMAWETFKQQNEGAKLVWINLQPYSTTQVPESEDVLHVGGFSDAVFDVVAAFSQGGLGSTHWLAEIDKVML
jgi:60 kDa SS-A/Ro ribonucleoprotein